MFALCFFCLASDADNSKERQQLGLVVRRAMIKFILVNHKDNITSVCEMDAPPSLAKRKQQHDGRTADGQTHGITH